MRAIDGRLENSSGHKEKIYIKMERKNKIMTIAFGAVAAVAAGINRISRFSLISIPADNEINRL